MNDLDTTMEHSRDNVEVVSNILLTDPDVETQEYIAGGDEETSNHVIEEAIESEAPLMSQQPKKPHSAWMVFSIEGRNKIMSEYKNEEHSTPQPSMVEITKMLGEKYRNLTEEEKSHYDKIAGKNKEVYLSDMAVWKSQEKQRISSGIQTVGDNTVGVNVVVDPSSAIVLPLARIRKAVKMNEEVKQINKNALLTVTKATELFIQHMAKECYGVASYTRGSAKRGGGVSSLKESDVIAGVQNTNSLRFLRHDFYAVSDPNAHEASSSNKRAKITAPSADKDAIASYFKPK